MRSLTMSLALVLLGGGMASAENLVSGPQVGEGVPGEFRVLFLNGEHAGEKHSPVSVKRYGLTALLFVSDVSEPLTVLVRRIDKQLDAAASRIPDQEKRGVFLVFMSDDARLKERLKDLIAKDKLKQVVVCFGTSEGLKKYEIADESELTVVIFKNRTVQANFAFRKGELYKGWADAIVEALSGVLPKQ